MGVIDIGSNSVRLVVFQVSGGAMYPKVNEKVTAGLGRGVTETGHLCPDGRQLALAALARFKAILSGLGVKKVKAVATAAVRVADDGKAFSAEAARLLGTKLSVLSGADEGRLAALGAELGLHRAADLVADLGGSSLEIAPIGLGAPEGESHMLGPLALAQHAEEGDDALRAHVRDVLASSHLLSQPGAALYAVGGAWRAFAKVAMHREEYPLRVLHGYRMSQQCIGDTAAEILGARGEKWLSAVAGRRAAQLPLTAIVVDELVQASRAEEVIVSSFGLREGVVAKALGLDPGHDGLGDSLAAFWELSREQAAFGAALEAFLAPVFSDMPPVFEGARSDLRLRRAACLLADAAGTYHPDHRHDMAFRNTLFAPLSGVSHGERVFLAAALGWRYARRFAPTSAIGQLLSKDQLTRAKQLGYALRLGAVFSGRSAEILAKARLEPREDTLALCLPNAASELISETVERRLNQCAEALGRDAAVCLD
ncbi:MAG: Ppx/GppA family phosphatase [Pseudomonadota bacterium]